MMLRIIVFIIASLSLLSTAEAQDKPPTPSYKASQYSAEFPFESRYVEVLGSTLHYIDEGSGDIFLFLHGNPTSSYLWRNVMRQVKSHGRIIAVDNIGFGKSDKPSIDYTLQTHIQYINAFVQELGLKDVILVVHDWGSVLGLNYAATHSGNVKGLVMMEAFIPPTFPAKSVEVFGPAAGFFNQLRDPVSGRKMIIKQNIFIEQFMANAALTRAMPKEVVDNYRAPFLEETMRDPILVWPNEIPIGGEPSRNVSVFMNFADWLKKSSTPKLLQYVAPGALITPERAHWAANNFRNIETQFVGYGNHFIQEDNPRAIGLGIMDWHRRNFK